MQLTKTVIQDNLTKSLGEKKNHSFALPQMESWLFIVALTFIKTEGFICGNREGDWSQTEV